jgi:uncharacterized protein (TIGR00297 family)
LVFAAKKGPGSWIIAGLIVAALVADAWLLRAIYPRPVDIWTFVALLWVVLSAPFLLAAGGWLYGLRRACYYLDRNKLEVRWPWLRVTAPLADISAIQRRQWSQRQIAFRGLKLFGYQIGYGEIEGLGRAWFCATAAIAEQWVVVTPTLALVISPLDAHELLAGWQERLALGPTQQVEPAESRSALLEWPLWRDRVAWALMLLSLLASASLFAHISGQPNGLPFSQSLASPSLRLALIGAAITLLNLGLGAILLFRQPIAAYLLFAATLWVQIALWIAASKSLPLSRGENLLIRLLIGLAISALIGWLGYRKRALAPSGVLGAILVGTLIFGFGGVIWGILLIAFFASSSALSAFKATAKESLAEKFAKGSQRDLAQALANGGLGALLAVGSHFWPSALWLAAYLGVMSAVNADTWATELGVLSKTPPRLITTGKVAPVGNSGAISALGVGASAGGAAFIGLLALLLAALDSVLRKVAFPPALAWWPLYALLGGVAGSLFDSLLGATVQGIYYCDCCGKETEQRMHRCGEATRHLRGWEWLDNDWVNFISSAFGGVIAFLAARLIGA